MPFDKDKMIGERIAFNRVENEKLFAVSMLGKSIEERLAFQTHLLDAMFSVIEAEDFRTICHTIIKRMRTEYANKRRRTEPIQ
jgi:hypothetical protein